MATDSVLQVLAEAKKLAQRYRTLTDKPLGITGEVGEYEAARLLGLTLMDAREAGYDATERRDGKLRRVQIKTRCLLEGCKPGQRMGSIDITKKFDAVLLVLLDDKFETQLIYEAEGKAVVSALKEPSPSGKVAKARNERGSLGISKFKSIGYLRWPATARRSSGLK